MSHVSNWLMGTAALIVISVTLLNACSDSGTSQSGASESAEQTAHSAMETSVDLADSAGEAIGDAAAAAEKLAHDAKESAGDMAETVKNEVTGAAH